jgi:two-component system alkaline phosphatase synthesis response regulator PhoP
MQPSKPVILYVDDDKDYLDATRTVLESGGYAMREARTAEEGLAIVREQRPDLILVDLMMEEIDSGTSFVKELRAAGCDVPVYMLSSVGDDLALTADAEALGLAGILQKPVDRHALLALIEARLAQRRG